jgi:hypothetical protein
MTHKENLKKMLVGLIMILALAVGITLIAGLFIGKKDSTKNEADSTQSKIKTVQVEKSQLPTKFPTDMPLENDTEVTQNYNATSENGGFQANRTFVTKKSLKDNYNIYTQYLKTHGWNITASVDQDSYKMVTGSKGNQQLQISISENSISKVPLVAIFLTDLP